MTGAVSEPRTLVSRTRAWRVAATRAEGKGSSAPEPAGAPDSRWSGELIEMRVARRILVRQHHGSLTGQAEAEVVRLDGQDEHVVRTQQFEGEHAFPPERGGR